MIAHERYAMLCAIIVIYKKYMCFHKSNSILTPSVYTAIDEAPIKYFSSNVLQQAFVATRIEIVETYKTCGTAAISAGHV